MNGEIVICFCLLCFVAYLSFEILEIEPRASSMLGKYSTYIELHPSSLKKKIFLKF